MAAVRVTAASSQGRVMMGQVAEFCLSAVHYQRGFDVDAVLLATCARLRGRGVRIGGFVQSSWTDRSRCPSSLHVTDLRSGETFDIWDARGPCARGCRLDERGLIDTEPNLMGAIADGVDLLVINRFGKAESSGRGLLGVFIMATDAGVPVLTAVRHPYEKAWEQFHGGMAHALPATADAVAEHYMGACPLASVAA
jgi:hypothetical protein